MATIVVSFLQNIWTFFKIKPDDLRTSTQLVQRLPIPEETKQFVYAVRDPNSQAVVYILAAQNLSEQSCLDVDYLIRAVQPSAVIAQIAPLAIEDLQMEEQYLQNEQTEIIPASPFQVIMRCFLDKISKDQYEKIAGCQVLKEIFGVGLYGHFLAAKRGAEQAGCSFLLLESPYEKNCVVTDPGELKDMNKDGGITSAISSHCSRLCLNDPVHLQTVRSLSPSLSALISESSSAESTSQMVAEGSKPLDGFQAPPFARALYPFLNDLYETFIDIPAISRALRSAQSMLTCIHEGKTVDSQALADVYVFRIAIEGLRIGLNNSARSSLEESGNSSTNIFSELPSKEKCHVLFAQALQSQAKKFGTLVAVVDASCLAGLRRHWNTTVPPEIAELASLCFSAYDKDDGNSDDSSLVDNADRRALLADRPVVAVGAGATAILGASSLSKIFHAPTLVKLASYKVPIALKHGLLQVQRQAAIGLAKIIAPAKIATSSVATTGSKASAAKVAVSAEKIRTVTHSVVTTAQRTSLMAVRTSFYEVMQKKGVRPLRVAPWATFGCSIATCAALLTHGDGIECVAESAPAVPMIASLGRGLEGLRLTSEEVRRTSGSKIKSAMESLREKLKSTR